MCSIKVLLQNWLCACSKQVLKSLVCFILPPTGRYPSNDEYVRVSKALVTKYPFLKDLEGNGYVSIYNFIYVLTFFHQIIQCKK